MTSSDRGFRNVMVVLVNAASWCVLQVIYLAELLLGSNGNS